MAMRIAGHATRWRDAPPVWYMAYRYMRTRARMSCAVGQPRHPLENGAHVLVVCVAAPGWLHGLATDLQLAEPLAGTVSCGVATVRPNATAPAQA